VDTLVEFRCIRRVSQERFHDPAPRFPPLAPAGGCSPASSVLSRRYDLLPPVPPHFVTFAWRYLSVRSLCLLRGGRGGRRGLELVTRCLRPGSITEEATGSRKFLGNPHCSFAHVQSTPAGLLAPDHYGAATWPLVCEQQRLPRKVFRRSIAWPSNWLSTLRRTGCPATTQDSLPAAGQALPDGLSTRKVPLKGFGFASYISSSFPKLLAAITSTGCTDDKPFARIGVHDRSAETAAFRSAQEGVTYALKPAALRLHRSDTALSMRPRRSCTTSVLFDQAVHRSEPARCCIAFL
jgi:hypothetical protein